MVIRRPGHTLVELIATLSFLGVTLGAVGAAVFHGARSTLAAGAVQDAVALAADVLDSLTAAGPVTAGERAAGPYRLRWDVRPASGVDRVEVAVEETGSGRVVVTLVGARIQAPARLP